MLEIKNIHKAFDGLGVPKGVSLSVEKGDVVAILGKSGSGKTTLLRCINFLETADDGELVFDGETVPLHNASKRDIARIRKKTAFVFQNYNLFRNKTALQNVTEGLIVARKMPKAQAEADKLIQNAQYLKEKRINEATEQVAMFNAMYQEYALNPEVTKTRMYYEAISDILPGIKLYINTGTGSDMQMLLPLETLVGSEGGEKQ